MLYLRLDEFTKYLLILPSNCKDCHFVDKHHAHIKTKELRILCNNSLRKASSKGPKTKIF